MIKCVNSDLLITFESKNLLFHEKCVNQKIAMYINICESIIKNICYIRNQ